MLKEAIERDVGKAAEASPWPDRFHRAGSEKALLTLGINPRAFDPFPKPAKGDKASGFAGLWRALDGIFLTLGTDPGIELRLALQGRPDDMPVWARNLFTETPPPSVLWRRFPQPAVFTFAARTDFANLVTQALAALPEADRKKLTEGLQTQLDLITRLDFFKDILPNLGPDWGLCVLPPKDSGSVPQVIAALAVKPGTGPEPVDETLFKGTQLLAGLAVAEYNRNNPANPIRVDTIKQGKVIVKALTQDKLFPAGFRPCVAVKDGFLLFASSPEAIARFGAHEAPAVADGETPLLRLSPPELVQVLKARRTQVLADLRQKKQLSAADAERTLDGLLELLDLFESVTVSQRSEPGQASWAVRVLPRGKQ
jgi:hypothetical protein